MSIAVESGQNFCANTFKKFRKFNVGEGLNPPLASWVRQCLTRTLAADDDVTEKNFQRGGICTCQASVPYTRMTWCT